MLDLFWLLMIAVSVGAAIGQGRPELVTDAMAATAGQAVDVIIGLGAVLVIWSGLARVAEEAGLTERLARLCEPVLRPLFPDIPPGHRALSAIALNVSANMLGLGNAATPFGLQAMQELEKLSDEPGTATPAMCRLLALNTAGLTLVPTTVLALRTAAGSRAPGAVLVPALLASVAGLVAALAADIWLRRRHDRRTGGR